MTQPFTIEDRFPLLDEILQGYQTEVGQDYTGYRNHLYRMVNFCFALRNCDEEAREKIMIAACFHDLGILTSRTFDYLPPSIALAERYLQETKRQAWITEISLMIEMHHKVRRYEDAGYPLVEVFRRGDLVDFSLGVVRCGLPGSFIRRVKDRFPNAGFHKRLVQLELGWLPAHPLRPVPVAKW